VTRLGRPPSAAVAAVAPSPVQVAAGRLFELCAAELLERGDRPTQGRVAEILGARPSQLSDVRWGRQGSLDLLARWVERWEAAGYGRLRLVVEPGEARVERVDGAPGRPAGYTSREGARGGPVGAP
jgi:hypothetical protein